MQKLETKENEKKKGWEFYVCLWWEGRSDQKERNLITTKRKEKKNQKK